MPFCWFCYKASHFYRDHTSLYTQVFQTPVPEIIITSLYNTVRYNMALDITRLSVRLKIVISDSLSYITYAFYS